MTSDAIYPPPIQKYYRQIFVCGIHFVGITRKTVIWLPEIISVTFLAGHGEFAPHMGDPHGDLQTSPQHSDPHGLGAFSRKTIHVDRRVVGWSAGRHVHRPCGGKCRHGLLEQSLIITSDVM